MQNERCTTGIDLSFFGVSAIVLVLCVHFVLYGANLISCDSCYCPSGLSWYGFCNTHISSKISRYLYRFKNIVWFNGMSIQNYSIQNIKLAWFDWYNYLFK